MTLMAAVLMAVLIAGTGGAMAQSSAPLETAPPPAPSEAAPPPAQAEVARRPADPASPSADDRRYTFHRINQGFVRLDSRTGQVAQCNQVAGGWTCAVAPEERAALDAEIARVQAENSALKRELLARGIELPAGVRTEPQAKAPSAKLPAEAEVDRAFSFMKDVWRRLIEMMAELQRDIQRKS